MNMHPENGFFPAFTWHDMHVQPGIDAESRREARKPWILVAMVCIAALLGMWL